MGYQHGSNGLSPTPPRSTSTAAAPIRQASPGDRRFLCVQEPQTTTTLFGATLMRGVEQAAVRETDDESAGSDADGEPAADDHDGLTVMSGDIRKLRDSHRLARRTLRYRSRARSICCVVPAAG